MLLRYACAVPLETGSNSGFKIYQPDDRPSLGVQVTDKKTNEDPDYPYWGGICGVPTTSLCWPDTVPSPKYILRNDTRKIVLDLRSGSGEGVATINYDGENKSFTFNTLDRLERTRYYRLQLKGEFAVSVNTCDARNINFNAPKLSSESAATKVISFRASPVKNDSGLCWLILTSTPTESERSVAMSLGALNFRIAMGIYDILPSGKHLFSLTIPDYISIREYNSNDSITNVLPTIGPMNVKGYVDLKASLNFNLLTTENQKMEFDTKNSAVEFFRILGNFRTNFLAISTTVKCQYIYQGKCALFDGNSYLPLSIGVRSDHLVRNTSTVTLKPGVRAPLTGPLGFKIGTSAPIQYMFGLSREDVLRNPASSGREFSGDVTMVIEGDF